MTQKGLRRFRCILEHKVFGLGPPPPPASSLNVYIKPAGSAGSDLSFQLLKRLGFESSRSAWATEFFQGQPALHGQTVSQNKNRRRSKNAAQGATEEFLGRPWAPSLWGRRQFHGSSKQFCFISLQAARADRQTDSSASNDAPCCASLRDPHFFTTVKLKTCNFQAAGGMVQWVKDLLCKHEDHSLIFQNPKDKARHGGTCL